MSIKVPEGFRVQVWGSDVDEVNITLPNGVQIDLKEEDAIMLRDLLLELHPIDD